jgi:hypothetical protein
MLRGADSRHVRHALPNAANGVGCKTEGLGEIGQGGVLISKADQTRMPLQDTLDFGTSQAGSCTG